MGMESVMERDAGVGTGPRAPERHDGLPLPAAWFVAVAGAFLAGVLTSFGQGVAGLASVANSAGPWFVVAVGLLLLVRPRLAWGMPLGVGFLLLMHVGYTVASNLRGHPDFLALTNIWVLLALPAGLLAGACAVALRGLGATASARVRSRALAVGVGAAILAGEGIRALLQVADTTGTAFWTVEIVAGAVVLGVGLLVARTPVGRVLTLGTALVGTAAVLGAFLLLGAV
jgi:hypothetical protein